MLVFHCISNSTFLHDAQFTRQYHELVAPTSLVLEHNHSCDGLLHCVEM